MEYRYMGKTGMKVSVLCLGAMTFGRETPEDTSYEIMDRFADAGGNFIDTADVYSAGVSETIVGKWLKRRNRDDVVIATKVRFPMGDGPNDVGLSRKHILAGVDASLRRLDTDYIDLYQVHRWDPGAPLEETLGTLNDLVRAGKVRYIGASNFLGHQLQKAVDISHANGWEPFTCLQPLYNLLDRGIEWELVPVCQNEGIGIIPWSPLRGGWLSGKYTRDSAGPVEGTRIDEAAKRGWSETWDKYGNERTWAIIDALQAIAQAHNKPVAAVALRWLIQKPGVTAPIIGMRTLQHFEANMSAAAFTLSAEEMARLDAVSAPQHLTYPYDALTGPTDRDR